MKDSIHLYIPTRVQFRRLAVKDGASAGREKLNDRRVWETFADSFGRRCQDERPLCSHAVVVSDEELLQGRSPSVQRQLGPRARHLAGAG